MIPFKGVMLLAAICLFGACQKEPMKQVIPVAEQEAQLGATDRSTGSTVVDIASANPNFSALTAAVVKTGLAEALSERSFGGTVFAPTNAAFAKLPAPFNTAENISAMAKQSDIDTLKNILLYHVSPYRIWLGILKGGMSFKTLLTDEKLTISRGTNEEILINGKSMVVVAEIRASNGIIHVIDNVLIP